MIKEIITKLINKYSTLNKMLILSFLIFIQTPVFAVIEKYAIQSVDLFNVAPGLPGTTPTYTCYDSKAISALPFAGYTSSPFILNTDFKFRNIKDRVKVTIDRSFNNYVPLSRNIRVKLIIDAWNAQNVQILNAQTISLDLIYNPSTGQIEDESASFRFENAVVVKVKVVDITDFNNNPITSTFNATNYPHVRLDAEIEMDRIYALDLTTANSVSFKSSVIPSGLVLMPQGQVNCFTDEYPIQWNPIVGAEAWELEWQFIEDDFNPSTNTTTVDFRFNSTRVRIEGFSTPMPYFKIPGIFEKGILVYRVRPIGIDLNSLETIYGPWSMDDYTTGFNVIPPLASNTFEVINYNADLNWIRTTSFAEEAKYKNVIAYYDGVLKERQTVTISTTESMPIVAQTIYDFSGRPAIQVLPTPAIDGNQKLCFRPAFNKNFNGQPYTYNDFDLTDGASCPGPLKVGQMSTNSGASKYYSSQGYSSSMAPWQAYVPNADGYPFTQVEYTPDNTGRISRQGAAGQTHRLSGIDQNLLTIDGKETRYYYGKPYQEQLYMMFGADVGNSEHYKRNVTIDPNGQASVTYIDPYGKVIATSLAGDQSRTPNLSPLPSSSQLFDFKVNSYSNNIEGLSKIIQHNLIVTDAGIHTFEYTVDARAFSPECAPEGVCYDCVYDLQISLIDECGNELIPSDKQLFKVGNILPYDLDCDAVGFSLAPNSTLDIVLQPGQYTLRKVLTVNKDALDYYKKQMLQNNTCLKPLSDFINEEKTAMGLRNNCLYTCVDCEYELEQYQDEYDVLNALGENRNTTQNVRYTELIDIIAKQQALCLELCKNPTPCDVLLETILADVRPGGQYATTLDYNQETDVLSPKLDDIYSVLNTQNQLVQNCQTANWRNPNNPDLNGSQTNDYYYEDGSLSLILVQNGLPEILDGKPFYDANGNVFSGNGIAPKYVKPKDLKNVEEFIKLYQMNPSWAHSLKQYHPEYCLYKKCKYIEPTYEYNDRLMNEDDASQALLKGYFNPVNNSDVTYNTSGDSDPYQAQEDALKRDKEPLFSSPLNIGDFNTSGLAWFQNHLYDYPINSGSNRKSIWELYQDFKQSHELTTDELNCAGDPAWPFLRALYISAKNDILRDYYLSNTNCQTLSIQCPTCTNSSGNCVGQVSIATGKVRRFPLDASSMGLPPLQVQSTDVDDVESGETFVNDKVAEQCEEKCQSYKDYWTTQLSGCSNFANLTQTQKDDLIDDLRKVCVEGCDIYNPLGSRQVAPNKISQLAAGEPIDFHEVLVKHFGAGAWLTPGVCDEMVLEWPLDYGHDFTAYEGPYADTCACNKKNFAKSNPDCPSNEVPEPLDDCACEIKNDAVRQQVLMTKNIPDELKCQNCADCRQFNIAYSNFNERYGAQVISQMDDKKFAELLEKWMNLQLGFNLKYNDYIDFAGKCREMTTEPDRSVWAHFEDIKWVRNDVDKHSEFLLQDSAKFYLAMQNFIDKFTHVNDNTPTLPNPIRVEPELPVQLASIDGILAIAQSNASSNAEKLACHCEKILTARWYKDKESSLGLNDQQAYEKMFGQGPFANQAEFDQAYKVCCNAYYQTVPPDPNCQQTGFKPGDKFNTAQKDYFDANVLAPNTHPGYVNGNSTDFAKMLDNDCNNPLTQDNEVAPLDNCACDKLMAAKLSYDLAYPGQYNNSNPPLNTPTFEAYIYAQYGVTGVDLKKLVKACEDNWKSGSGEATNGQPNPWPGLGATWSKVSKENLSQDTKDFGLYVPKGLLCNPPPPATDVCRSFPPDCYTLRWVLKEFLEQNALPQGISLGNPHTFGTPEYNAYNFYSSWENFYELFMNNKYSSSPDPNVTSFFQSFANFANAHNLVKQPCPNNTNYSAAELLQKFKTCLPLPCKPRCEDFQSLFNTFMAEVSPSDLPSGLTTSSTFKEFYEGAIIGYYNSGVWKDLVDNFLNRANYLVKQRCPKANSDVEYTFTQIWHMMWYCFQWPIPEGVGSEPSKPKCTNCFTINYDYLKAFEKFLNQINYGQNAETPSSYFKINKLDFDDWYLNNTFTNTFATNFYSSILYNGNSSTTLKYHIDENTYGVPFMEVIIDDVNGFKFGFTLEFPENKDIFNYGFIKKFKNIRPIGRINCGLPKGFEIEAEIIIPDAYNQSQTDVYLMTGTFTYGSYASNADCYSTCVRLCNKPQVPAPKIDKDPCEKMLLRIAYSNALMKYNDYLKEVEKNFEVEYIDHCLGVEEEFKHGFTQKEYHFTLYQYDQAGNLIKTVPPEGVDFTYSGLTGTQRSLFIKERIDKAKAYWSNPGAQNAVKPKLYHTLTTHYQYNTLNQLVWQKTPDAGVSELWYDALGRIAVSRNSKQAAQGKYSYIMYDPLGRTIESGEKTSTSTMSPSIASSNSLLPSFLNSGTNTQVSRTLYDAEAANAPVNSEFKIPRFALRGRSLGTFYYNSTPPSTTNYFGENCDAATHFSYDIHGNVTEVIQQIPLLKNLNNQFKSIVYTFDLLSGKTKSVAYQEGQADQFYHRYFYDADNRLTRTETSRDGWDYQLESKNFYYLHGPLARLELGTEDQKVQGVDYAYGINGWLKAVNAPSLSPTLDMGKDGNPSVPGNAKIARDGFAFMLGYHNDDYSPVGGTSADFRPTVVTGTMSSAIRQLYNGNISFMQTSIPDAVAYSGSGTFTNSSLGNVYHYDQLNRITEHKVFDNYTINTNAWPNAGLSGNDKFHESFSYDATGNIISLTRNGNINSSLSMDDLNYSYDDVTAVANEIEMYSDVTNTLCATVYPKRSHKLYHVKDNVASSTYGDDYDNITSFNSTYSTLNTANNFGYDELGNLIRDNVEEISTIEWNADGKISKVIRSSGSNKPELEFLYDASGSRLAKIVKPRNNGTLSNEKDWKTSIYVKDGSDNVMAIYELSYEEMIAGQKVKELLKLKELHLYGSSRIGIQNENLQLASQEYQISGYSSTGNMQGKNPFSGTLVTASLPNLPTITIYKKGLKQFELSNHLGNVLITISDRKAAIDDNADFIIDYYLPDISSITDYYAFGSSIPERSVVVFKAYRYGFNNQEKEEGLADCYAFEYRIHDSRIGRFLSVDPLEGEYPWNSTFAFAENRVIDKIDLEGLEMADPIRMMKNDHPIIGSFIVLADYSAKMLKGVWGFATDGMWKANTYKQFAINTVATVELYEMYTPGGLHIPNLGPSVFGNTITQAKFQIYDSHVSKINEMKNWTTADWVGNSLGMGLEILAFRGVTSGVTKSFSYVKNTVSTSFKTASSFGTKGIGNFSFGLKTPIKTTVANVGIKLLPQAYSRFPRIAEKFKQHGGKWVGAGIDAYYKRAISLADSKIGGDILGFTSKEGWVFRMNSKTGEFLTIRPNGEISTFYRRLTEPEKYWKEQIRLYGK